MDTAYLKTITFREIPNKYLLRYTFNNMSMYNDWTKQLASTHSNLSALRQIWHQLGPRNS